MHNSIAITLVIGAELAEKEYLHSYIPDEFFILITIYNKFLIVEREATVVSIRRKVF